jgi:hypothetical protein
MFLFQLKAQRQIGLLLRNGPPVPKFQAFFGVERFFHGDTLETTFSHLEVEHVQSVVTGMNDSQEGPLRLAFIGQVLYRSHRWNRHDQL